MKSFLHRLYSTRPFFLVALVLFRLFLDAGYVLFVSEYYLYAGFDLQYENFRYLVSWLCYLAGFLLVSHRAAKVSDFFFVTAILAVMAPLTSLYGLNGQALYPAVISLLSLVLARMQSRIRRYLKYPGSHTSRAVEPSR
jgi:hypothetical protein